MARKDTATATRLGSKLPQLLFPDVVAEPEVVEPAPDVFAVSVPVVVIIVVVVVVVVPQSLASGAPPPFHPLGVGTAAGVGCICSALAVCAV